jgi:hypothetical protein
MYSPPQKVARVMPKFGIVNTSICQHIGGKCKPADNLLAILCSGCYSLTAKAKYKVRSRLCSNRTTERCPGLYVVPETRPFYVYLQSGGNLRRRPQRQVTVSG